MKKLLTIVLMAAAAISANAQNVQVHYDFGRHLYPDQEEGRQSVTMTLEQFKADKWGSWFYFVDVDFSNKFVHLPRTGSYTFFFRPYCFIFCYFWNTFFRIISNQFSSHPNTSG